MAPARTEPITTLIALVRRAGALMVDELVERLRAAGFEWATAAHQAVFENLSPQGTRITELAAHAKMTHQSMGELVAGLERLGYLERRADPADGRARLVRLTPQGRRFVRRALQEITRVETDWHARLQTAGCPDLRSALESAISDAEGVRSHR